MGRNFTEEREVVGRRGPKLIATWIKSPGRTKEERLQLFERLVADTHRQAHNMAMRLTEEKLAEAGATVPGQRTGRFVSVICLAWPDGHAEYYRGEAEGNLVWPPRGAKGFGYDPVFQPAGFDVTFGEMSAEEKHGWKPGMATALSHRARAFRIFAEARLGVES